ncbi:MAG: hypothetical protein WA700_00625 [Acidobacteriaceae bacterium]
MVQIDRLADSGCLLVDASGASAGFATPSRLRNEQELREKLRVSGLTAKAIDDAVQQANGFGGAAIRI